MDGRYDHRVVERKWSERWERDRTHEVDLHGAERPYYNLMMFPYPSAKGLHVGNTYAYVGSDIHGRFMRARGYDVFEPFGFDAFGLHSENYALKTGTHPARLVPENVKRFRRQLKRLGAVFDWAHEVDTTDPRYYRWTQWIFLRLHEAGLAYRKAAPVNWCPSCKTVLADEQAYGGACERCGTAVEQRDMRQWFFRITAYAERLLDNLDGLDWSTVTTTAQRQWIGRSEGAEIRFAVPDAQEDLHVFTTRPDTLWGATYMVLAPEHPLVERITTHGRSGAVRDYVAAACRRTAIERGSAGREKSGVFTGACAINPATGQKIAIWVADYVLMTYGSGAVMGVPAHDVRDFEFAAQFGLPLVQVISPDGAERNLTAAYVGEGVLINSGPFSGARSEEARWTIADWLAEHAMGGRTVTYRLRDWCISRQRYWGSPIPVVHCDQCGVRPVPEQELPVLLPFLEDFHPDGSGRSPLARSEAFAAAACPECGGPARRETDVMDNFLDSAWYFLRYPSAGRDDVPFDLELTAKWLPVDMYIGGNEHAVLHLMYTRFVTMALKDLGLIGFEEPFRRFRANGTIVKDGAKMSKSKGNVINPDVYLDRHGADTLRTYLMFMGPFHEGGDFRDDGIVGVRRFLERMWRYAIETDFACEPVADDAILGLVHQKTKKVTDDIAALRYNTAVAALMELLNGLTSQARHHLDCVKTLLKLASPFAPFITHELWERIGGEGMICDAPWPEHDPSYIQEEDVEFVIEVNGKVRATLTLAADASQAQVQRAAFASAQIGRWTRGKEIVKTVFVPGKLLNIVVSGRAGSTQA